MRRRVAAGKAADEIVDVQGAVFHPVPKATTPIVLHQESDFVMFTCPRSAVPVEVFKLVELWHSCRLMKMSPRPGGFLDQPLIVRRAFPIFEAEMAGMERASEGGMMVKLFGALVGRRTS